MKGGVWGLGSGFWGLGLGFGVWSLGSWVWRLGFGGSGSLFEFGVSGLDIYPVV